jgi:hypothetical protein
MSTTNSIRRRTAALAVGLALAPAFAVAAERTAKPRDDSSPPAASRHEPRSADRGDRGGSGSSSTPSAVVPRGGGGGSASTPDNRRAERWRRGSSGRDFYRYHGRHYFYDPYWSWGLTWYGWWGDPWYNGYYNGPGGYGPGPWRGYTRGYPNDRYGDYGALDLDLKPGKTEIYLDGQYVGTADDFDGFPSFLWLPKGTYDLVFYRDGFQTIARQYSIYPGLVVDVEDRLQPGESIRPEDLVSTSTEHRDDRLRRDREREAEARARERYDRDRYDRDRYDDRRDDDGRGEDDRDYRAAASSGRLRLHVVPGDASVYLDGRFVGTGEELAGLHAGLIVDPGDHVLQIVRPGRESAERRFAAAPGEEVALDIDLDED